MGIDPDAEAFALTLILKKNRRLCQSNGRALKTTNDMAGKRFTLLRAARSGKGESL
jgi:hypothetical protein